MARPSREGAVPRVARSGGRRVAEGVARRGRRGERCQRTEDERGARSPPEAAFEGAEELGDAPESVAGSAGEAADHHGAEPSRHARLGRRRSELAAHDGAPKLAPRRAGEGMDAVRCLVERDDERELVRAGVEREALVLLGSHVHRRSDEDAGASERRAVGARRRADRVGLGRLVVVRARVGARNAVAQRSRRRALGVGIAREPEVDDTDTAVVSDNHVVRFEVAVDEPGGVRRGQPFPRRQEDAHDGVDASGRAQPLPQRHAVDELHRDEDLSLEDARVVDRNHVRMGQACERLGLAEKPSVRRRLVPVGGGRRLEDLEGYRAIELWVEGSVELRHAPLAGELDDHESTDDRAAPERRGCRRTLAASQRCRHRVVERVARRHERRAPSTLTRRAIIFRSPPVGSYVMRDPRGVARSRGGAASDAAHRDA